MKSALEIGYGDKGVIGRRVQLVELSGLSAQTRTVLGEGILGWN